MHNIQLRSSEFLQLLLIIQTLIELKTNLVDFFNIYKVT